MKVKGGAYLFDPFDGVFGVLEELSQLALFWPLLHI